MTCALNKMSLQILHLLQFLQHNLYESISLFLSVSLFLFAIHKKTDLQDCFKLLMVLLVILEMTDSFPTSLKKWWVLKGIIAYHI